MGAVRIHLPDTLRSGLAVPLSALLFLTACGGGSGDSVSPPTYTIGGSISGLSAAGLVLANGADTLSVQSGATSFAMPKAATAGSTYDITVQAQPTGLQCVIGAASGTVATTAVTSVTVTCAPPVGWIWLSGSSTNGAAGAYGTEGVAAAGNVPGARQMATSWTDPAGHLWLFGGRGPENGGDFNDLWSYNSSTNQWTWIDGSNAINGAASYGTQGTPAGENVPGARDSVTSWTDPEGNLWLFGGEWFDASTGAQQYFNDLWKYDTTSGQWTWVSGASTADAAGTYGVQGSPSAGNVPGARAGAIAWSDAAGNLWLFGGWGYDGSGSTGYLADLWKYDVAADRWTWISGSSGLNVPGTYGTERVAAAGNAPGSREYSVAWMDKAGRFWLFGGRGYDSAGGQGDLGDIWTYDPQAGEWVWVNGSSSVNSLGVYGTQGVAAVSNTPGARDRASAVIDGTGIVWLFGGEGLDTSEFGDLNDLWKYDVASGEWTWVSGSSAVDAHGNYATQDVYSSGSAPGARYASASWVDQTGRIWLFGGMGCAAGSGTCTAANPLNDLWSY